MKSLKCWNDFVDVHGLTNVISCIHQKAVPQVTPLHSAALSGFGDMVEALLCGQDRLNVKHGSPSFDRMFFAVDVFERHFSCTRLL